MKTAGKTGYWEENMYVITGATGNTGGGIAEKLLARGEKVRDSWSYLYVDGEVVPTHVGANRRRPADNR